MNLKKSLSPFCSLDFQRTGMALAASLAAGCVTAGEIDIGNPDFDIRWDNTVKYNYAYRVESQDPDIVSSPNNDDGDRNFDKGTVSNRVDLFSELDVVYRRHSGVRVSAASWYDDAYKNLDNDNVATSNHLSSGSPDLGLSNTTKRFHRGPSGEILDAFVFTRFDLGDMPLTMRAGQHSLYWGESVLSPIHGVSYGQTSLDLRKLLSVPGTEAKELMLPRNSISAQLQTTPELSLAAQYFLDWEPIRIPESGSYLGGIDLVLDGGESLIVGPGNRLLRGNDVTPDKRGDFGLLARWSPAWLDGTLGFYYRNTADIQPQVHVRPAVAGIPTGACGALGYTPLSATDCYVDPKAASIADVVKGNVGKYYLVYPDDIDVFGFSIAKNIEGVSLSADINYRHNMPLDSSVVTILPAALAAVTEGAIADVPSSGHTGGAVGNTWHGVFSAVGSIAETPFFDSTIWMAEVQWNRWDKVTQGEAVFKGRSGYDGVDKVTKDYFGLSATFTPVWYQVFPGVDLSLPLAYSVGLHGTSAVSAGGSKGAGTYSIGLGADVYQDYQITLRYVDYTGSIRSDSTGAISSYATTNALISDRGFVSLTLKTSF